MRSVRAAALALVLLGLAACPAYAQTSCDGVSLRSPYAGDTLRGSVPILGSARIDGFGFYKVEWASADDGAWSAVSGTLSRPVTHGLLDTWDTSRLPDGRYRLRLIVVDTSGQEPCQRSVDGLLVANSATYVVSPTVPLTPTLALRAARRDERSAQTPVPAASTVGQPAGESATEADRASTDHEADQTAVDAEGTSTPQDFPIQVATAADEGSDAAGDWHPDEVLRQMSESLGAARWPRAFGIGATVGILGALLLTIVLAWRSR